MKGIDINWDSVLNNPLYYNTDWIVVVLGQAPRVGEIHIPTEITDEMMPGVISIPHGWGHTQEDTQLDIANSVPGVSLNDITDDSLIDIPSGTSVLNGFPVTVKAVGTAPTKKAAGRSKAKPADKLSVVV